jgi:hypothetical protein
MELPTVFLMGEARRFDSKTLLKTFDRRPSRRDQKLN